MKTFPHQYEYHSVVASTPMQLGADLTTSAREGWEPYQITPIGATGAVLVILRRPFKHPKVGDGKAPEKT